MIQPSSLLCSFVTLAFAVPSLADEVQIHMVLPSFEEDNIGFHMTQPIAPYAGWKTGEAVLPTVQALGLLRSNSLVGIDDTVSMVLRVGETELFALTEPARLSSSGLIWDGLGALATRYNGNDPLVLDVTISSQMNDRLTMASRISATAELSGYFVSDNAVITLANPYHTPFLDTIQWPSGGDAPSNTYSLQEYWAGQVSLGYGAANTFVGNVDHAERSWLPETNMGSLGEEPRFWWDAANDLVRLQPFVTPDYSILNMYTFPESSANWSIIDDHLHKLERSPGIYIPPTAGPNIGGRVTQTGPSGWVPGYNPWSAERSPGIYIPPYAGTNMTAGDAASQTTRSDSNTTEVYVGTKSDCGKGVLGIYVTYQSNASAARCPGTEGFHEDMRGYIDMLINHLMNPDKQSTTQGQAAVAAFAHRMSLVEKGVRSIAILDSIPATTQHFTVVRVILPAEAVVENKHSVLHDHWLAFDITLEHKLLPYIGESQEAWSELRLAGLPIIDFSVDAVLWKKRSGGERGTAWLFGWTGAPKGQGFERITPDELRRAVERTIAERLRNTSLALAFSALDSGTVRIDTAETQLK